MAITLSATKRDVKAKKAKKLRKEGFTPAVIYGPTTDTIHLALASKELEKAVLTKETAYELDVEGEKFTVTLQAVERDFLKDCVNHVDFLKA